MVAQFAEMPGTLPRVGHWGDIVSVSSGAVRERKREFRSRDVVKFKVRI